MQVPSLVVRRLIVVAGCAGIVGLVLSFAPRGGVPAVGGSAQGDVALYRATVGDMQAGRSYYDAAGQQLRERGFPTRSPFNWRQPALYQLLAAAPIAAHVLIVLLGVRLFIESNRLLAREALGVVPIVNALVGLLIPPALYLTEAWAGGCLALSVLAYARREHYRGAIWGLVALFVRELAAPYCVLAACMALWRRRWRELAVWGAGGACYAAYYGLHVWSVLQHVGPDDRGHAQSWLYLGGLPFLLRVWQANGLLLLAPPVVLAPVVAAGVAVWWSPRVPPHVRAAVVLYSLLFLFIGQPFNQYWGLMIAPTVSIWLGYAAGGWTVVWMGGGARQSDTDLRPVSSITSSRGGP